MSFEPGCLQCGFHILNTGFSNTRHDRALKLLHYLVHVTLRYLCVAVLCLVLAKAEQSFAQQTNTEFGKNRVQFHDKFDDWLQYESENYITYWYGEARNVGQAAVLIAEANYPEIQELLEHQMSDKIELIIYTDLSDLKQSNIGAEDAFRNEENRVKVVGNKVFIYFDGDHAELRRQIREGTASVILSSMMFGENLQEIVQNAVLLDIPLWFSEGLVAYVGESWSTEADEQLRQYLLSRPDDDFEDVISRNPRLGGHAWWYYISQTYGKSTIGNLLYLTRISRSVESAIDYVYALSFDDVAGGWSEYFRAKVQADAANRQVLASAKTFKNKHRARITQLRLSPDGKRVAYAINEIGKQQVYVEDLATRERKKIFRVGYRNAIQETDYRYPLLAWNPNNTELAIVYEENDVIQLRRESPGTGERPITEPFDPQYQRVYSIDYINGGSMVVSAGVRGITDIYKYILETRQSTRLTDDYFNELDVRRASIAGLSGFIFVSNRIDTALGRVVLDSVLPTQPFNVFFLPDDRTKYEYAIRLTNNDFGRPFSPVMVDSSTFAYLGDKTGVANLYTGRVEEYTAYQEQVVIYKDGDVRRLPLDWKPSESVAAEIESIKIEDVKRLKGVTTGRTDLGFGLDLLDVEPRSNKAIVLAQYSNGLHNYYPIAFDSLQLRVPRPTQFGARNGATVGLRPDLRDILPAWLSGRVGETQNELPQQNDKLEEGVLFQSRFEDPKVVKNPSTESAFGLELLTQTAVDKKKEEAGIPLHQFRPARIRAYQIRFRTDYLTTTFNNEPLFGGLDNFAATPQDFRQQPSGLLVKLNNKELFEDYTLELGARFATTFDASEYYGYLDTRKKRIDIRYGLYHGTRRQRLDPLPGGIDDQRAKARSIIGITRFSYPFSVFSSLQATTTLRVDRFTPLVVDVPSLSSEIDREQRIGLRLEYVFDNTLDYAVNVMHGSRAKFYVEVAKRFDVELTGQASFNFRNGLLTLVGFDARHYFRVLKHGTFAVRAAAATTVGAEKILFFLGSTDGAVASQFNDLIPVAAGEYAYEMAITNLRGFSTNIRNGNSFAVSNAELRLPVFRYAFPNTTSNFLRSFQLVGFTDVGTAWTGRTPFTRNNPINTVTFDDDPSYTLTVNYFRDPVVLGFGGGARVSLFGYFLRVDRGWGVETGQILDPRWHLSLGLDF